MVEENLRLIFDAEQKAKKQIEAAQLEALTILESARKESEKLKEEAKLEAKAKVQKVLEESRKKAEAEVQELLSEARKQQLALERKAKSRREEATKLVLDTILG